MNPLYEIVGRLIVSTAYCVMALLIFIVGTIFGLFLADVVSDSKKENIHTRAYNEGYMDHQGGRPNKLMTWVKKT